MFLSARGSGSADRSAVRGGCGGGGGRCWWLEKVGRAGGGGGGRLAAAFSSGLYGKNGTTRDGSWREATGGDGFGGRAAGESY